MTPPPLTPEQLARQEIDRKLSAAGWIIQNTDSVNLSAGRGVAVREFPLKTGFADYLLFVDRTAAGVVEAKAFGATLSGVHAQAQKYSEGLPDTLSTWRKPLPFLHESTGVETLFTDGRDPDPRSRALFTFHRPETLAEWAGDVDTLRARLQRMPPLITGELWPAQVEAITNLEHSFADNRPRALIQMATGSGKTFTAVNFVYRLIKHADARRVLFLVDRSNLGRQTYKEFQQFTTPDDGRKFTELYNVQHLQSNTLDDVSRVCISTIQRVYSMLRGEELDPVAEEQSLFDNPELERQDPREVTYNPGFPIEYFDFVITDECHRSIYNLWRGVLEYFDAFLVGLTATPSKQTFGFFRQNLVMEYSRQRAVADGVNVDGEVYRIRTKVTEDGSKVDAGYTVGRRNRLTRQQRWEQLDEELEYSGNQLDRDVVAPDQIRTIIQTYRDKLPEIFPGRKVVPKTLIFAKDDAHAEEIVHIVREEFNKGNDFCQKITYRVTGVSPEDLIAAFRNSYNPRIAVTVDMVATGTDIKPLEALLFMRDVKSRVLYEQMLGRGTRVIKPNDLQVVSAGDAKFKDRFVIVDAIGVTEHGLIETQTIERKPGASFENLLQAVALDAADEDTLSSLAGRLARLDRKLTQQYRYDLAARFDGVSVQGLANDLLSALDPDAQIAAAQEQFATESPTPAQVDAAAATLMQQAASVLADNPDLRAALIELHERNEQIIDEVTRDTVREAGFSLEASQRARATVDSFRQFIDEHKDAITALELLYSRPRGQRHVTHEELDALADVLRKPPYQWTTEQLWNAYAQVEADKVRGAGSERLLTDLISLVRHAVQLEDELVPYPEQVQRRYAQWLADQEAAGRAFTQPQRWWLDRIAERIGIDLAVTAETFAYGEFYDRGGLFGVVRALGPGWMQVVQEMNEALVE